MKEDQIINQLKGLNQIKPNSIWRKDTISYILDFDQPQEKEFSRGFLPFFDFGSIVRGRKLAPAFISLTIAVIVGSGFLIYPYIKNSSNDSSTPTALNSNIDNGQGNDSTDYLVLATTKLNTIEDSKDVAAVVSMLDKAGDKISTISKDPTATAEAVKSVAIINKKIENIEKDKNSNVSQEGIKQLKESSQTLTSLTSKVLEDKINSTTAELIKTYEDVSLPPEQETLFQQAKEDYNNKNFEKALEEILQIQDN